MKPIHWVLSGLAFLVLMLAAYVGWDYLTGGTASPEQLATTALTAGDPQDRLSAIARLSLNQNKDRALPQLKRVESETTDPKVKIAALHAIMAFREFDTLPLFL